MLKAWEYKTVRCEIERTWHDEEDKQVMVVNGPEVQLDRALKEYSEGGWELVSVVGVSNDLLAVFKRPSMMTIRINSKDLDPDKLAALKKSMDGQQVWRSPIMPVIEMGAEPSDGPPTVMGGDPAMMEQAKPNRFDCGGGGCGYPCPECHRSYAACDTQGLEVAKPCSQPDRPCVCPTPKQCPKCNAQTGDCWSQCGGSCPMPMSPHFDPDALKND